MASLDKDTNINVQLSRREIQTWNQDIGSEDVAGKVEDNGQEISTMEAIEALNKVIAWSENNIQLLTEIFCLFKIY